MKHNPNPKRGRSRNNGKRPSQSKNQNYESSGSDNKIRGTAQQVLDKYLALARDAYSFGDRVAAENYYQYADHYYRIINANQASDEQPPQNQGQVQESRRNRRDAPQRERQPDTANTAEPQDAAATSAPSNETDSRPAPKPEIIPA